MSDSSSQFRTGVIAAAIAYFCWGLFPLFWKLLSATSSLELMAHRVVWCMAFVAVYLAITAHWRFWLGVDARIVRILAVSAVLIAVNWWVYIWAVNNGRVVESSLGYFINPLVNVVFGVIFLRERLNPFQWLAVSVAACGVGYLTLQTGEVPWVALALAFSFGSYGLIRKIAPIDPLRGLAIESAWLFVPAFAFLLWQYAHGTGSFGVVDRRTDALIILTGPITAVPLLLFAYGARRIPLSLIGILQYIGPTLQFLTGVLIYHEPFSQAQLYGFGMTWLALAIYTSDGLVRYARARAALP